VLTFDAQLTYFLEGITAANETRKDAPQGLGDFQRRANRDRNQRWDGRWRNDDRDGGQDRRKNWDVTPRSERSGPMRDDAPSLRVPNVGWDSTPRKGHGGDGGWGGARSRAWDAPTPRTSRGESPEDDRPMQLDAREWEEEEIRLDRDWYSTAEEGGVFGDDTHNPLAQYQDMELPKLAEVAAKQVVRHS
jgi:pre-mRNA-splicing factor ATP-dependent RNA helicase DHX38/PRP16